MNRWSALAALLLAVAAALALRIPNLSTRPLHNDEAVNATKVAELWEQGRYAYDPDEYHGPTLHYATLPFLAFSGARNSNELKDATLRLAPVVFGVALIFLLPLFASGISRSALLCAGIFIAISPAMVFYSRYFIHEMLLIFFTALTLGAGWRYTQTRSALWAALTGAGVGLMFATKETFVITMAAVTCAGVITPWWLDRNSPVVPRLRAFWNWRHAVMALAAALTIWILFFTSFFTNTRGPLDSILTYFPWLKRAGGHSPHIHPWYFYFQRLAWFHTAKGPIFSEALILILAVIGGAISLRKKWPLPTFLTIHTIFLATAYSAISYKTPWCLLNFYFGVILVAGIGAVAVIGYFEKRTLKIIVAITLFALTLQLTHQSYNASFVYAADRRNPYVYAQTVPDLLNLAQKVEAIARLAPTGYDTTIKVIAPGGDYWPLPWHFRRFRKIGWYEKLPDEPYAPIIIAAAQLDARLDEKSDRKWIMVGYTELRPQNFLELYVQLDLWTKYVATLPRERD